MKNGQLSSRFRTTGLPQAARPFHHTVENTTRIALLLLIPETSLKGALSDLSIAQNSGGDLMTPGMEWLLIAWGVVTGVLLILLFYRSTLTRQEDDQLFIDESSSSRATEQSQLIAKVNKINPLVKLVGATSGLMILAIAGWAVYLGLNSVQP